MALSTHRWWNRALLYPLLLSAYPTLALLGHNVSQVRLSVAVRPLVISVLVMLAALAVCRLLFHDWAKAAAVSSLGFLLFFTYGHVYTTVEQVNATGLLIGRHRFLAPLWVGLFVLGAWRLMRAKDLSRLTAPMNVVAGIALAIPVLLIGLYYARSGIYSARTAAATGGSCALRLPEGTQPPDVYYIILDGYMRDDLLLELTGYDNTPFLEALTDMGFVVARGSQSNYPSTAPSLITSLNLEYLPELGIQRPCSEVDVAASTLIRENAVRRELECLGYRTVAFETGYVWSEWDDADFYLKPRSSSAAQAEVSGGISGFERMLIEGSLGLLVTEGETAIQEVSPEDEGVLGQVERERTEYTFEQLARLGSGVTPKLVFAHILAPHGPFVFGRDGEPVYFSERLPPPFDPNPEGVAPYWTAYADELAYINRRLLEVLHTILSNSGVPPIILIQGDHALLHGMTGVSDQAFTLILNAYYLPDGGDALVYDTISPVNSFRLVFNHYFDGQWALLDDISYSPVGGCERFEPVPATWPGLYTGNH